MSDTGQPKVVGWKVNALSSNMASVRYRALLPVIALEAAEVGGRLFSNGRESNLDGLDALVIVKSFTPDDLRLAQLARGRGMPVIYDLCDNIFIGDYGIKRGLPPAQMFQTIAQHVNCVVTTTEPLAEVIREQVPGIPVVVIPDGIESSALSGRLAALLREPAEVEAPRQERWMKQRLRSAVQRVRTQGVLAIPSLMMSVARHVRSAVSRRVPRGLHAKRRAVAALPLPAEVVPERPNAKRIVWFGNHGAEHGRFGMLDILEYRVALEALAAEQDVELVVISNNRQKYEASIRPLAIPSRYVEWAPSETENWLRRAALVIVPNSGDAFSICKSANRTVTALSYGVPVVATMTPALHALADFIDAGDPLQAFRQILADPVRARSVALEGYQRAEALFGLKALQVQWLRLLRDVPQGNRAEALAQPYLAVVLHLIQDLDLALPILEEARGLGITCEAWCSGALIRKSPRVLAGLQQHRIPFRVLPDEPELSSVVFPSRARVLLTIAETNLGPHRVPRILSEAAVRQGLLVATLQHGFENVALTYDDAEHGIDTVSIAAQKIYIWGPLHTLHPRTSASVRARCVPVGCPKHAHVTAADLGALLPAGRPVVGIFENLHWHRYSDAYRQAFMASVEALTAQFPEVTFLLKPHHAGMWLTRKFDGTRPGADNLVIADPQAKAWERHTASALLGHMAAVITTPSTVALDAARIGLPVAVAAGDLHLDNYLPLTLLNGTTEWIDFVGHALDPASATPLEERSGRFVDLTLIPGNAARRIVEDLRATAGA